MKVFVIRLDGNISSSELEDAISKGLESNENVEFKNCIVIDCTTDKCEEA